MTVTEGVVVVPHDPEWPLLFRAVGERIRAEMGDVALRIDHIGSTAVPGLDAKPVVDVQVSVAALEPVGPIHGALDRAGFVHRPDNPELTKRYFRERPGDRRTHIHVRQAGSFSEQFALLFRDYLRVDPGRASAYAELKRRLAKTYHRPEDRHRYVDAKEPFIWETVRLADRWAQRTGWTPGPSDC